MPEPPVIPKIENRIREWAIALGFADAGISRLQLEPDLAHLKDWLAAGFGADMAYMSRSPEMRADPSRLHPGTVSVISLRMNCRSGSNATAARVLANSSLAYIARYALGRDYHKLLRGRLKLLGKRIETEIASHGYRVLTDSAPSLEKALARNAGLGWIGKNTLVLERHAGSWFLLGEIYTDLPLIPSAASAERSNLCGSCHACIDVCPTQAIVAPYRLDARRCISYLTIENRGAIPVEYRAAVGNRVFGCDDCQLVCPWNRYAQSSSEDDFRPRHGLDAARLVDLFEWTQTEWQQRTEGMALRRTGYRGWLRNLAVGLGNASPSPHIMMSLERRQNETDELVAEHVRWALEQQRIKKKAAQGS